MIPIPRSKPVYALDLVLKRVYVVVKVYRGIEWKTKAFKTEESAKRLYREYAKECRVPYDRTLGDYDWTHSDYTVW